LLKGINAVHNYVGNFGWAILILTTLMKIFLWPLAVKSHKSMAAMKALQPKMNKLKEKFGADKMRLNQEMMALYKKENVKPMGGCLPILLQNPIFFCLYKVLSINIEMRHAPFIWWIKDLAEPDPTSFVNLFGLLPFDAPQVFMIGLLPILMGLTMFIQQKLTPSVGADPSQEKVMLLMPLFLTYVFASFPAGLVIYWLWSNVLSILQQVWMNRRYS
jgi:YidC/Oxa1 family membrane protein insertase